MSQSPSLYTKNVGHVVDNPGIRIAISLGEGNRIAAFLIMIISAVSNNPCRDIFIARSNGIRP